MRWNEQTNERKEKIHRKYGMNVTEQCQLLISLSAGIHLHTLKTCLWQNWHRVVVVVVFLQLKSQKLTQSQGVSLKKYKSIYLQIGQSQTSEAAAVAESSKSKVFRQKERERTKQLNETKLWCVFFFLSLWRFFFTFLFNKFIMLCCLSLYYI